MKKSGTKKKNNHNNEIKKKKKKKLHSTRGYDIRWIIYIMYINWIFAEYLYNTVCIYSDTGRSTDTRRGSAESAAGVCAEFGTYNYYYTAGNLGSEMPRARVSRMKLCVRGRHGSTDKENPIILYLRICDKTFCAAGIVHSAIHSPSAQCWSLAKPASCLYIHVIILCDRYMLNHIGAFGHGTALYRSTR